MATVGVSTAPSLIITSGQSFLVSESAQAGDNIGRVEATGCPSCFKIAKPDKSQAFEIDKDFGVLSVKNALALLNVFSSSKTIDLEVEVSDRYTPFTGSISVQMWRIKDIGPLYLAETTEKGNKVATIEVEIKSPFDKPKPIFKIASGNDENLFAIDDNSGEITVANPLRMDIRQVYKLEIEAKYEDSVKGIASSVRKMVTINLWRMVAESFITIPEMAPQGYSVGRINVIGATPSNFKIDDNAFNIDAMGQITVANSAVLDFEITPVRHLKIKFTVDKSTITKNIDIGLNLGMASYEKLAQRVKGVSPSELRKNVLNFSIPGAPAVSQQEIVTLLRERLK
jgi:hypothetical protein